MWMDSIERWSQHDQGDVDFGWKRESIVTRVVEVMLRTGAHCPLLFSPFPLFSTHLRVRIYKTSSRFGDCARCGCVSFRSLLFCSL
jgi:hypothetical protein